MSLDGLRALAQRVAASLAKHWKPASVVAGIVVLVAAVTWIVLPAPSAEGAMRGHTVEIHPNAQITVRFSQSMNHKSVEQSFQLLPSIAGTFIWEGNAVTFAPAEHFIKGETYELTVTTEARNSLRKHLPEAYRQQFVVLDYPEVAVAAPVEGSVINQDQHITVLFDHPLRKLTQETQAPELVTIEPPVAGEYLWLGTTGFEFIPNNGWPAATRFTVTVPAGTKTADGGFTIEDYVWSFQTENVYAWIEPETGKHDPRQPIRLSFNYPVDLTATKQAIKLVGPKGDESKNLVVTRDLENKNQLLVKTANGFQFGETYTVSLPDGFRGGLGELGLDGTFSGAVAMADLGMRLQSSDPADGGQKCVECSVTLNFNNPVNMDSARKQISISPKIENMDLSSWEAGRLYIYGHWKASTDYTITIGAGLADTYGQVTGKASKIAFKTEAYSPRADLAGYSMYGVLAEALPRVYQVRTLNLTKPVNTSLCSQSIADYVSGKAWDCSANLSKQYDPSGKLNDYKVIDIDLDQIAGNKLSVGLYRLTVDIPELRETNEWYRTDERTLMIVNTALTLKQDGKKALVWAVDMQTGQPVGDLDVTLWSGFRDWGQQSATEVATKKTDKDGLVVFETNATELAVSAQSPSRLGFVTANWNDGISTWNYNLQTTYGGRPDHIGYLYTDRRIYRPDQLVYFKGVIRRDTDAKLSVPEFKEADVVVRDPVGKEVYRQRLSVSEFGTFHGELQLNTTMALGGYSIAVINAGSTVREGGDVQGTFEVREFRRPDFKVDMTLPVHEPTSGDVIRIPVHAEYYHGIPLANAKATYTVSRNTLYFQPLRGEWYSFQNNDQYFDCWWYCRAETEYQSVQDGTLSFDSNGDAMIELPSSLTDYDFSANYVVSVTVSDINSRTVSASVELPVHLGDYYFGIRADYSGGWDSTDADFNIVSVNHDGSMRPNISGTVKFYKRTWSNISKTNTDGSSFWEWQKNDELVETRAITTDEQARADVRFTPPSSGEYVAIVEGRDSRGNVIAASANRYVYRGDGSTIRVSDDHQMKVVQNKASYDVGETASLAVQTPYKETKALLTIERDTIRSYKVITLGSDNRTVPITIDDASTPNIYVSVLAVQGGGSKQVPEFRLGYANLQVNTTKKILDLKVETDKQSYKPGDTVTLNVQALRDGSAAAQAEVSLAVVDERVVALLGSIDKNILGKFWFPRDIGVTTAQSLTMLVTKVFVSTEGGDGKGGESNVPAIRGNFKDTAYWNATVRTGNDGRATVTFTIPDNLTSWQVLAIGTTRDTVVGSAETSIVTRRDLMVEPLLPRIIRYNDRALLGATVFNSTDTALTAKVTMDAGVLDITDSVTRTVSVAPRSRAAVYWNVIAPRDGSSADITVTATAGEFKDGFNVSLPILPYSVPETVSASGLLERNITETFEIPEDIIKDAGQVRVSVQPNVGNGLQSGLDYLVGYPYGCAEQKTSALLANLMYQQLVALHVSQDTNGKADEAKRHIEEAIKLIVPMQRYDGGFGFWTDSPESYPFLTAYVFWGLVQAQQAGFAVDSQVLDAADNYLRQSLGQFGSDRGYSYLDDAAKAQAIFALSERSTDGLSGYAATLYENRAKLPADAQAFLAMAYANIDKGISSSRASRLMDDLKNRLVFLNPSTAYIPGDETYYWYFNTELRSTALYMQALLKIEPKSETIERLVRYLIEHREDGYWGTTQNTAMSLLSLVQYVRANPINETAQEVSVFLNNTGVDTLSFPRGDVSGADTTEFRVKDLLAKNNTHEIGLEKASDTRYFYDINMTTYRQIDDIEPFENGFTVIADAYALTDKKNEHPLSRVALGDTVRVRVKLLVPKNHRYVALEAHLPAGLEAIDFALKTSPQELSGQQKQCVPGWYGDEPYCMSESSYEWRWWWQNVFTHVELRDDRVFLFADQLDAGVYEYQFLAQAITPGEFRVPPARVYEFYNPMANAHNEGKTFTVTAK